jgi:gluconokinase
VTGGVVVMGVTGSGKSTVGAALAARLGWSFVDGDDHHSAANIAKMRRGVPLDDADRAPWLATLNALVADDVRRGRDVVLACSALTRAYRRRLAEGVSLRFVYLRVPPDVLAARLRERAGHFMPPALLASQLATLEEPTGDEALVVDDGPVDSVVGEIVAWLAS